MNTLIELENIESAIMITSSNCASYNFVASSFAVKIGEFSASLQNGDTFIMNDYQLPENYLSVYEADSVIAELDNVNFDEIDEDYINDECETSYTLAELQEIYQALSDITNECQAIVDRAVDEADEAVRADEYYYCIAQERERFEDYDVSEYRACSEAYSMRFDSQDELDDFIEKQQAQHNLAYETDTEHGIESNHESLSNF